MELTFFYRMALLVTILLMLLNFTTDVRDKAPHAGNAFTALDLWLLSI